MDCLLRAGQRLLCPGARDDKLLNLLGGPMRRLFMLAGLLIGLVFGAGQAAALPAPMSESDLLQKSDLVALVRIKSVTCVGVSKDAQTGESLPSYSARAELMEVIKGEDVKGDTVNIDFHAIPTGVLGPWTVYYYPGEMVWTHLIGNDGEYTTIWCNGRGTIVSKGLVTDLPTTRAETDEIPQSSRHPSNARML